MSFQSRVAAASAILILSLFGGALLLHHGIYGFTVFTLIPMFLGALAVWTVKPATAAGAGLWGAFAGALGPFSTLVVGIEGLYCVAMSIPLAAPMGALGGIVFHLTGNRPLKPRGYTALVLLAAGLTWDVAAEPPVFAVRTSIPIAASPEKVWDHVVAFADLPEPREWFFKAGIAYPKRARIEGAGPGAIRYCEFSTGAFVEPIEVWDSPNLLRFRVTSSPAPMEEWSPYSHLQPKHLHGYLVSERGQFRLTRTPGGTHLEGATWYRHGLWPAPYWRWWSDAIIHRIHLRVLNHIRELAEQR